jgi:hypothetical protein
VKGRRDHLAEVPPGLPPGDRGPAEYSRGSRRPGPKANRYPPVQLQGRQPLRSQHLGRSH